MTEGPMYVGQHVVFDSKRHNRVWNRVTENTDIAKDIYANPYKHKNTTLEHHISVAIRELTLENNSNS